MPKDIFHADDVTMLPERLQVKTPKGPNTEWIEET